MITDKSLLAFYADTVSLAYELDAHDNPRGQLEVCAQIDDSTGLKAMAYWDAANRQLLISIAGTDMSLADPLDTARDLWDDVGLAIARANDQMLAAKDWVTTLIGGRDAAGTAPMKITFAGHSLGGFLAQNLSNLFGTSRPAEAVLFNSTGIDPDLFGRGDATFASSTIVCSDPRTWSIWTGAIHSFGDLDPAKLLFTWGGADSGIGFNGHGIADLVTALKSDAVRLVDAAGLEDLMLQSLLDEETTVAAFEAFA